MSTQTTGVTSNGVATDPFDSWVMPSTSWFGPSQVPLGAQQPTSMAGVPQNTGPVSSPVSTAIAYGKAATSRPVYQQPVFWSVVLMVVSVIMFAHLARIELK